MSGLSTAWLAARRGLDPVQVERRRLDGELYAVRDDSRWVYPAWQFDETGEVRSAVRRLLELAAERHAGSDAVASLLERRVGLVRGRTVRELLLNGGEERALAEARRALTHEARERSTA